MPFSFSLALATRASQRLPVHRRSSDHSLNEETRLDKVSGTLVAHPCCLPLKQKMALPVARET
jgi:hypothetical protein